MSVIAMEPSPHSGLSREAAWEGHRHVVHSPRREPPGPDRTALPPIRQALPDFELRVPPPNTDSRTHSSAVSPTDRSWGGAVLSPPDYIHSPNINTRRGMSGEEERDNRGSHVPRQYASPRRSLFGSREISPPFGDGERSAYPARQRTDSLGRGHSQESQFTFRSIINPSLAPGNPPDRLNPRPDLPSLGEFSRMTFTRHTDTASQAPQFRRSTDADAEYSRDFRPIVGHPGSSATSERPSQYRPNSDRYDIHPPRTQSFSDYVTPRDRPPLERTLEHSPLYDHTSFDRHPPPDRALEHAPLYDRSPFDRPPLDRVPFSSAPRGYGQTYPDYGRPGEQGGIGMDGSNGDTKPRKRRGNLPKDTTDKLRSWFVAHVHHPYPTEDQKQAMVRETGLQMNQISNWFINARRRQLPEIKRLQEAERAAQMAPSSADRSRNGGSGGGGGGKFPHSQRDAALALDNYDGTLTSYELRNGRKRPCSMDDGGGDDDDDGSSPYAVEDQLHRRSDSLRRRNTAEMRRGSDDEYETVRRMHAVSMSRGSV